MRSAIPYTVWFGFALISSINTPRAFENERLGAPIEGVAAPAKLFEFYIRADGRPLTGELYKIEVASDSEFEEIVATFDMSKQRGGWALGDPVGFEQIPPDLIPENYEGIHLRTQLKLSDGEYYWRASKTLDGSSWQLISGVANFRLDTSPPSGVDSLKIRRRADGTLDLEWQPVSSSESGDSEEVAGYRVYRYDKLLKRYPSMTRYIVGELEGNTALSLAPANNEPKIVFYRVHAVDAVGNEIGRVTPAKIGSLQSRWTQAELDRFTNPQELGRMYQEAKDAEKR